MQNEQIHPQLAEELKPMPEGANYYIRAELLLPKGEKMATGHVVSQVIMPVEMLWEIQECIKQSLLWSEVTEWTTNIIAELMYTQCDADCNEYLHLDALVDYNKDNKTITLTEN